MEQHKNNYVPVRVGSSNFNNRSICLDYECDVAFQGRPGILHGKLAEFRNDLIAEHLRLDRAEVEKTVAKEGSLMRAIDKLRSSGSGRTLIDCKTPEVSGRAAWLADNEILDPESPEAIFEPIEKRGLFGGRLELPFRRLR